VTSDPTIWFVARASGLVAYALLTASVLAGLILKSKPFGRRLRAITAMEIHRTLSFLGLAAIGLHATALVLDKAAHITLSDLFIPGVAAYRPVWTGLGVISAELMVALIVSFPLRKVFGFKTWRKLHWASYGTFALAATHGITAGTDTGKSWTDAIYIGSLSLVAAAIAWRVLTRSPVPARAQEPAHSRASGTELAEQH
jgi:DMSO/TMAO reductase YedYZ heme-binding membrane subunit